jgi:hypothetical protein
MPTCSEGNCGFICQSGTVRCGDDCANLSKDAEHCGSCDHSCAKGGCKNGKCEKEQAG